MRRVFLDANVFFVSAASSSGGSYFILELAKKKFIQIVTVAYALSEAERNIQNKLGEAALKTHYQNLLDANPSVQSLVYVPSEIEERFKSAVPEKDIPILAGAFLSGVKTLITLDRKHLLDNKNLEKLDLSFEILTPGDFIRKYFTRT